MQKTSKLHSPYSTIVRRLTQAMLCCNAWKKFFLKIVSKTILEPRNGLENDVCKAPMFFFSFFDENESFFDQNLSIS